MPGFGICLGIRIYKIRAQGLGFRVEQSKSL